MNKNMKVFFAFVCGYFLAEGIHNVDWVDLTLSFMFGLNCLLSYLDEKNPKEEPIKG